jgi:SAM-dependent methyltransferase
MMLGFLDVFQYLECNACGCLQLLDPPADMGRYYPSNYPVFQTNQTPSIVPEFIKHYVRKRRNQGFFEGAGWLARFLARRYDTQLHLKAIARIAPSHEARILDVGCGPGSLLMDLKELGYRHLLGVDRFISQPIDFGNGVRLVKGVLGDLAGTTWDLIMFHHSFEHMPDPAKVLQTTMDLLARGGRCLIRIPVIGWAWQHYGVNWAQIDAPRHFFLHSEASFRLLARAAGFDVLGLSYDSSEFQFWASELYSRNVPLVSLGTSIPETMFSKSQLRNFRLQAAKLNAEGRGDAAAFYLVKP